MNFKYSPGGGANSISYIVFSALTVALLGLFSFITCAIGLRCELRAIEYGWVRFKRIFNKSNNLGIYTSTGPFSFEGEGWDDDSIALPPIASRLTGEEALTR